MPDYPASKNEFEVFVETIEPKLRSALVATYGQDIGREATVDALLWVWRNWERAIALESPVAYLYRVGESSAKRSARRLRRRAPSIRVLSPPEPWFEPQLLPALRQLSRQQRIAVVLCHGMQWTRAEVAELLEVSTSTVQTHLERGLARLRQLMEVDDARTF